MVAGSILIIEDEPRLRNNLQILLTRAGYVVTTVANGSSGLQCLQQHSFDLIITDLVMDGLDGFALVECIAAQVPETPIIVMTGYASTASAAEALRKGARDYIAKPFSIESLKDAIARALENVQIQQE